MQLEKTTSPRRSHGEGSTGAENAGGVELGGAREARGPFSCRRCCSVCLSGFLPDKAGDAQNPMVMPQ